MIKWKQRVYSSLLEMATKSEKKRQSKFFSASSKTPDTDRCLFITLLFKGLQNEIKSIALKTRKQ